MTVGAEVAVVAALAVVAASGTVAPLFARREVPPLPLEPSVATVAAGNGAAAAAGNGARRSSPRSGLPAWAVWTLVLGVVAAGVVPNLAASVGPRAGDAPETGTIPGAATTMASAPTLTDLRAAVAADPTDVQARLALADRYLGMQRLKDATDEYLAVLRVDEGNADARAALGLILYLSGRPLDGLKAVRGAIADDPSNARARLFEAVILYRGLGRAKAALAALHAALDLSAGGPDGRTARQLVAQIRKDASA